MKKLLIAVIVLSVAMFSCDDDVPYIKIEKSLSKSKTISFNINTVGSIDQTERISSRDLVESLTDDPATFGYRRGYTITGLSIQSINVVLNPKAGNKATGINSASYISSTSTPGNVKLINEQVLGMGNGGSILANTHLALEGVDAVNGFLRDAIGNKGLSTSLLIKILGKTSPATERAVAELQVNITFNIEYWYCEQSVLIVLEPEPDKECQ